MSTDSPPTVVVLPTYNERENLPAVCGGLLSLEPQVAVMVVDDSSPDGTGALADELAASTSRLLVVHREAKQGLGPAYVDGLSRGLQLGFRHLLTMDADLSHDPHDVPRLVEAVADGGAGVAIGSRWVEGGGTRGWPLSRRLLSRGGSRYARMALGTSVQDMTGGFKCFHRSVLESIDLSTMRSSGYAFNIELTHRALHAGFRVAEVPILFTERIAGRSKMSLGIMAEALLRVPQLRLSQQPRSVASGGATAHPAAPA